MALLDRLSPIRGFGRTSGGDGGSRIAPPNPATVAPAWGWRGPGAGRAAHVDPGTEYQATTSQLCGLYPYQAGSGAPPTGVPVGRHQLWGEVVCLDPFAWLSEGLITNPGMFMLGETGTGKSAMVKRLTLGLSAFGIRPLILGDPRPDYTEAIGHLGGQVIRVGRGLDRINPLDSGPLGQALPHLGAEKAERLRLELRGRRLSLLLALATLVRRGDPDRQGITNAEEHVLGRAVDVVADRLDREPTVPDVLRVLQQGPDELRAAAQADDPAGYRARVDQLVATLSLLCERGGRLSGVFDAETTTPIDLAAPGVSVDISPVAAAGGDLVVAAMLCTWAYGFGCVDAAGFLADEGVGPRRRYFGVLDELWRALRGAPGLVEHADHLTRLNRAWGMAHAMVTHSLADLDALPTEEDRAKAQGFIERSAITMLAGLPPRELARVDEIVPLSGPERELVGSWSAPDTWQPAAAHPGRGKYLIKAGKRLGIPVETGLVGVERRLYDTDAATRDTARDGGRL